jgi:hypothetical protein
MKLLVEYIAELIPTIQLRYCQLFREAHAPDSQSASSRFHWKRIVSWPEISSTARATGPKF